jgi:hypothetical protein
MFKTEGTTIKITRGDIGTLEVVAENDDKTAYEFKAGDIVRIKVFKKKDCACVVMHKDVEVQEVTTVVKIFLESEDTKIGELTSKKVEYWYEIELNPDTAPQTIVAYDDDGEKLFILYPEGADIND